MASIPDHDGGYVRLYRRLLEHSVFRNDGEALAFAWLVMKAAWRPVTVRYKDRRIPLLRGEVAVSVRDMASQIDRPKGWVERLLRRTTEDGMIATRTETGVSVIKIVNYDTYQPIRDLGETPGRTRTGQSQDSDGTQNKEGKERKEGKEEEGYALAREDAPFQLVEITAQLSRLAGVAHVSPGAIDLNLRLVKGWLDMGADPVTHIAPTIARIVLTSKTRIKTLAYFEDAVREDFSRSMARQITPNEGHSNGRSRQANGSSRTNANAGEAIFAARRELGFDREPGDLGQPPGAGGGSEGPAGIVIEADGGRGSRFDEAC